MNDPTISSGTASPIPADNPQRSVALVQPNEEKGLLHLGVVGDTYTILVKGADTDGRYCLIDMYVPPGGGPPPHRHDFEESFSVLEGEVEVTFRGEKLTAKAGDTLAIPANASHQFKNAANRPARLLCICSPAGQDEFFMEVGIPVASRTAVPPKLNETEQAALKAKSEALASKYRTEMLEHA